MDPDRRKVATKNGDVWTDEGKYWQEGPFFLERDGSDVLLTDSCGSYNKIFRIPVAVLRELVKEQGDA